jgi:outer membrane protein TolC
MVKRRILMLLLASVLFFPAAAAEQELQLSLDDALLMALENNLDLMSARMDPEISEQSVMAEKAGFDGTITGEASFADQTQEVTNISQAPSYQRTSFSLGWSQKLNFGAEYSATLDSVGLDAEVTPDNIFFTTPTSYDANLSLGLTIPLLQGFGKEATRTELLLARGNLEISREQLRQQAHAVLESVENAYWDLLAAKHSLRIARISLKRAEDQLELNRKKVEVGTLAPIEITEAEAGVASQEETVIIEETNLENAEDELRRLLGVPESDPMWTKRIIPSDEPVFAPTPIDLEASITEALASRPEMASARRDLRNKELSRRTAKNRLRHQLDLRLSYVPTGTDVDEFVVISEDPPVREQTNWASQYESIREITELENRTWSAALNYTYPFNRRAARANYRTAELNQSKARVALQNQEQTIRVEVRRAVRSIESGVKRVNAARANVELQRKKLEAEEKKFDNGMSTSFEILTYQRDLATAELAQVRAHLDYIKALVALEKAKGTLLQARGLTLAE